MVCPPILILDVFSSKRSLPLQFPKQIYWDTTSHRIPAPPPPPDPAPMPASNISEHPFVKHIVLGQRAHGWPLIASPVSMSALADFVE